MTPLAAGNKQLLETIFQSVFSDSHVLENIVANTFIRSLIVSPSPLLHAEGCRSVLSPRFWFLNLVLAGPVFRFRFSCDQQLE